MIKEEHIERDDRIEVGDTVTLKSGGPPMTVISNTNTNTNASCCWFGTGGDRDDTVYWADFPSQSLIVHRLD